MLTKVSLITRKIQLKKGISFNIYIRDKADYLIEIGTY